MIPNRVYLAVATALAITHHASADHPITTAALEAYYKLPPRKLEPIVRKLAKAGILRSVRGAQGGYFIPWPEQVMLDRVVASVVEKSEPENVLPPLDSIIVPVFDEAAEWWRRRLQSTSLQELAAEANSQKLFSLKAQALEYVI